MSSLQYEDGISAEVRELLVNYRNARQRSYEPCSADKLPQCLEGLQRELALLHIHCPINVYTDLRDGSLTPPAMVALVNAVYILLHEHKKTKEQNSAQNERVRVLESSVAMLNSKIEQLQNKLDNSKRKLRQSVAEGLRAAEHASKALNDLKLARARIAQLTAQLAATEHSHRVRTTKAEKDMHILQDRLRNKNGYQPATLVTSMQGCDNTQKNVIIRLQRHNAQLIDEVLALKRDLITHTLDELNLGTVTDPLKPAHKYKKNNFTKKPLMAM